MNGSQKKRGSVLPTVLIAVIVLELFLTIGMQLYRNRSYTYQLLVDHYQSQSLLLFSEHLLTEQQEYYGKANQGVLRYNIGQVTYSTVDTYQYELTSRLLNGYQEEHSFKRAELKEANTSE